MFRKRISKNFRYRTNEVSLRSGFLEETFTNRNGLNNRIDYWKYTLYTNFNPAPGKVLGLFFSHTTFDYFAIVLAAFELRLKVTVEIENQVDFIIHTLPENEIAKFRLSRIPMYHYFDISDDFV